MGKSSVKVVEQGQYKKGGFLTLPSGEIVYVEDSLENAKKYVKDNCLNPTAFYNKNNPEEDKTKVRVFMEYVGNKQPFWKINQSILLNRIFLSNVKKVVVPFAGSGSDFLTIAPQLIKQMETSGETMELILNDWNQSISNLFSKITDQKSRKKVIKEIEKIIKDQQELVGDAPTLENYKLFHKLLVEELNKLELAGTMNVRRAALFLILMNTTFGGNYEWKKGKSRISISSDIKKYQKYDKTFEKIKLLSFYFDRFKVIIENKDYKEIIKKYDGKNTLFLIDPPYLKQDADVLVSTKVTYGNPDFPHEECINMVMGLQGQFIYHNYRNNVQTKMFNEDKTIGHIEVHKAVNNTKSIAQTKKPRCVEVIYFSTWDEQQNVQETVSEVSTVETQPTVEVETAVEPTVQIVPATPVFPVVPFFSIVSMIPSGVVNNNTNFEPMVKSKIILSARVKG